ncbi:MFS transporter [Litchfieldia salsa]|uniref:Major Facilitator Superfamily protein n=1 Tax=Litchfieldia salsa TaxID=930152 RepID=A0A1H0WCE3_9BACI|nr:MFS transporter [Litchfieldia salsa]SDP88372.1 Major Facilitator Superfamily protein [Litchfieldia salsa]
MKDIITIFKNRNYSLLFFAAFTSQLGSIIGISAFMLYLLNRFSEQPFYATMAELMYSLPTLFVFFLVGVFADKMDRQKVAAYADFICVLLSVALIITIYIDWMPLTFFLLFLRSAVSKFFHPAESAMIQGILTKNEYTMAAGLNQMTGSLFMLFGNALGIFIYWNFGIQGAILFDAITYLISAILILTCKINEDIRLPNGKMHWRELSARSIFGDFKEGLAYILDKRLLVYLIIGFFVFGIVNGGLSVMPTYILKYKLAPDTYEQVLIYMGIVFGSSVLVGSVLASVIAKKLKLYQMIIIGLLTSGVFITVTGFSTSVFMFLLLNVTIGLSLPLLNIAIGGWLPRIVDPKMMGRVQGWITPTMMLSQSITLGIIMVTFQKSLTIEGLFFLVGGCIFAVGVFYAIVLPPYGEEGYKDEKVIVELESKHI